MKQIIERLLQEVERVSEKYQDSEITLEALQEIQNWAIEEAVDDM